LSAIPYAIASRSEPSNHHTGTSVSPRLCAAFNRVLPATTSPLRRATMGCCQPKRRMLAATWGTAASLRRGLVGEQNRRSIAPGASIVVACAEQCCGSQAMRSIVWAQPAALPLREGAPLQGGASFPQVLKGPTGPMRLGVFARTPRSLGAASCWSGRDQRDGTLEGERRLAADPVALAPRGAYGGERGRPGLKQRFAPTAALGRGQASPRAGCIAAFGGGARRVPAPRGPAHGATRGVAQAGDGRCAASAGWWQGLDEAHVGSAAHPRAGTRSGPQEQGSGRSDGTPGAPKKVQALWGDADESTPPKNGT
jgi:hypothetical protein